MMTTEFDSFDESIGGGFVQSPLFARNKGRGPIWLATRLVTGGSEYELGYIYELHSETLAYIRYGRCPTPLVDGIGGDGDVIWYCDNKFSARDTGEPVDQVWELSPQDWANGEDVPIRTDQEGRPRIGGYANDLWFHGIGGDVNTIWALVYNESITDWRIVELDVLSLSTTGREVDAPFRYPGGGSCAPTGCGGSEDVIYVSGTCWDTRISNLVSKWAHNMQTFRGQRFDLGPSVAGFQAVGGSSHAIWALGDATYYRNLIYEIDPVTYQILQTVPFEGVGGDDEVAYAIGGK